MAVDALIGLQRGDEGKGRVADFLANNYQVVARGNGGANAGHTFMPEGSTEPFVTNLLPSGIAHKNVLNVLAQGIYLDTERLREEIEQGNKRGLDISKRNLAVSNIAQLVMPHHILLDREREDAGEGNGSTRRGIAQAARDKYSREGIRVEDVLDNSITDNTEIALEKLREARADLERIYEIDDPEDKKRTKSMIDEANADSWASSVNALKEGGYVTDTRALLLERLQAGQDILAEGAQSHWLDINHGLHPNVTSSHTTVLGLLDGLGVGPKQLRKTIGVAKLVNSHVGDGTFKTEIEDLDLAATIRGDKADIDSEHGATTKRARRIGYLDLVQINTAATYNDIDEIILNKLDHFPRYGEKVGVATAYRYGTQHRTLAPSAVKEFEEARVVYDIFDSWTRDLKWDKKYEELPPQAKFLVEEIERYLGRIVSMVGVGPNHNQLLEKPRT